MEQQNEPIELPTAKSIGIRYGLIMTVVSIVYFLIFTVAQLNMSDGAGRWGSMVPFIILLILAHREFKKTGDGYMSFGQGMGIATWSATLSTVLYMIFFYVYIKFVDSTFVENVKQAEIDKMQEKGMGAAEIEQTMKYASMFMTPEAMFIFGVIIGTIFSLGIALIITLFTRKRKPATILMVNERLDISLIIPAKDEQESLPELSQWIKKVMLANNFSYEVIFIDDGSTDDTWEEIRKISAADSSFKGIRFNRNFGKSAALHTGFKAAQGKVVITMDADLQDSPDEIPELYKMITEQKFDLVSGWKKKRHDPISKTLPSKFFNFVTRRISGIKLHDFNCGLKAYQYSVVKNISVYGEMHRYIPVIAKWAGFTKIGEKVVEHYERKYGYSKFGWDRLVKGFLDLLSITFMGKFRRKPMHFFGSLGILSFLLGFIFTVKLFWDKMDSLFISKIPMKRDIVDQPIFFLALVAVVIGVQLFLTGYLAEMIAMQSLSKRDYLIIDKVGMTESRQAEAVSATIHY